MWVWGEYVRICFLFFVMASSTFFYVYVRHQFICNFVLLFSIAWSPTKLGASWSLNFFLLTFGSVVNFDFFDFLYFFLKKSNINVNLKIHINNQTHRKKILQVTQRRQEHTFLGFTICCYF